METETETPYVHPSMRWRTWCDECQSHTEDADHGNAFVPRCAGCNTER